MSAPLKMLFVTSYTPLLRCESSGRILKEISFMMRCSLRRCKSTPTMAATTAALPGPASGPASESEETGRDASITAPGAG